MMLQNQAACIHCHLEITAYAMNAMMELIYCWDNTSHFKHQTKACRYVHLKMRDVSIATKGQSQIYKFLF